MKFPRMPMMHLAAISLVLAHTASASNLIPQDQEPAPKAEKSGAAKGHKKSGNSEFAQPSQKAQSAGAIKLARLAPIKLMQKEFAQPVQFTGRMIGGASRIYWQDGGILGGRNIKVESNFINGTSARAYYAMYIAFYDKNGAMVTAAGQPSASLEPGKTGNGSMEMALPKGNTRIVSTYQLTFFDGPQEIGNQ
jgi:hypothetical protein